MLTHLWSLHSSMQSAPYGLAYGTPIEDSADYSASDYASSDSSSYGAEVGHILDQFNCNISILSVILAVSESQYTAKSYYNNFLSVSECSNDWWLWCERSLEQPRRSGRRGAEEELRRGSHSHQCHEELNEAAEQDETAPVDANLISLVKMLFKSAIMWWHYSIAMCIVIKCNKHTQNQLTGFNAKNMLSLKQNLRVCIRRIKSN